MKRPRGQDRVSQAGPESFSLRPPAGSARTDVPSLCPEGPDVMASDELVVSKFASSDRSPSSGWRSAQSRYASAPSGCAYLNSVAP